MKAKCRVADSGAFFRDIWRLAAPEDIIELRWCDSPEFGGATVKRLIEPLSKLDSWLEEASGITGKLPHNMHFTVLPRQGERGTKDSFRKFVCLWADVDGLPCSSFFGRTADWKVPVMGGEIPEFAHGLDSIGMMPNYVVDSGYGVHMYWILSEPFDIPFGEQCNRILARICTSAPDESPFGGDVGAANATHTLRFPWSCNCKVLPARRVTPFFLHGHPVEKSQMSEVIEAFKDILSESGDPKESGNSAKRTPGDTRFEKRAAEAYVLDDVVSAARECPVLSKAWNFPGELSYRGWFSLAAFFSKVFGNSGEQGFHAWSERDGDRYSASGATSLWNSVMAGDFMPYSCRSLQEAYGCELLAEGKCKNLAFCLPYRKAADKRKSGKKR